MTGKEFKDNLDDVVERLLKKLDKKTFMEELKQATEERKQREKEEREAKGDRKEQNCMTSTM